MYKKVIGYGVHKTEHKGTKPWFTAPILEGDPIDRFEVVWYGDDAKTRAWDWVQVKTGKKEPEKVLAA